MTVIVKATGPADILAMVPSMVGFLPRNSVVFLAFRGTRTCGAIRFDLPKADTRTVHKRIATTLVGTVCKLPDVDAIVVVIYTDEEFGFSNIIPRSEFADILGRRIEQSGFELRGSICQASDGWASQFEPIVPVGGHSLDQIAQSNAAAAIPDDLRAASVEREVPTRIPAASASELARMTRRLEIFRQLVAGIDPTSSDPGAPALDPLYDIPLFAETALRWSMRNTDDLGALLVFALQEPNTRDLIMLQWATSIRVGDQLWNEGVESETVDHSLDLDVGKLMMGIEPRLDAGRIEIGIELLLILASRCADEKRMPLLCMLTWLNWALGRGTQAGRHLEELLAIDPQHSMALLLRSILGNGMLPEWAFEDPALRQR